jgi:hypothetical protein
VWDSYSFQHIIHSSIGRKQKKIARVGDVRGREFVSKIAFTFTIPYLQGFPATSLAVDASQTFHTCFVKAM